MPVQGRLEKAKNAAELVALVIAGFWAVWLFIYKDLLLPSRIPTHVEIKTDLEIIGTRGDFRIVRSMARVKNNSDVRAHIVGSLFNIRGYVVSEGSARSLPEKNLHMIEKEPSGDLLTCHSGLKEVAARS